MDTDRLYAIVSGGSAQPPGCRPLPDADHPPKADPLPPQMQTRGYRYPSKDRPPPSRGRPLSHVTSDA